VIAIAKSALRHNVGEKLHQIKCPALLVWGQHDTITPAFVGERFHELFGDSRLFILEKCGHAPMMEHPGEFNRLLLNFLIDIGEIQE
jgi:pimeloyl-ACP methyl ester carboxylesterase